MRLSKIPGNQRAKEKLKELLKSSSLPSPLLFTGPQGVGKGLFAEGFAREVLEKKEASFLNFRQFFPQGKGATYLIEEIKEMIDAIVSPPFEAKQKIILLHKAERMPPISANALLKTLEAPPSHSVILLTASHRLSLLPTLLSRCFEITFTPIKESELTTYLEKKCQKSPQEATQISLLADGQLQRAKELASSDKTLFFRLIAAIGSALVRKDRLALAHYLPKLDALIGAEPISSRMERKEEACLALFYWYRDLELLKVKGPQNRLFFFNDLDELMRCVKEPLPSIEKVGEKMEKIREALFFHIKLSSSLDFLL